MTDNITHSLFALFIGIILIHYLKFKGDKKWPIIAIILAGNAPDIDIIIRAFGALMYITYHRVWTHSIFGMIFLAVALALIFAYVLKKKDFLKYLIICGAGVTSHVFLDLLTSYGTVVLYPFNETRYAFSIISVVDVYVITIFAVGLWFLYVHPEIRPKVAKATLFIFFVFLLFKSGLYFQALDATSNIKDYDNVEVVPHLLNPFGWKVIISEPNLYITSDYDPTVGGFKQFKEYPFIEMEKIEASKKSLIVRQYLEFAKFPYPRVLGNTVRWGELRFTTDIEKGILATIVLDDNLNVVDEKLGI